ncbi:MAG TPA: hypothetical protein VGO62_15940 [Myxococcota bacterium]|jgi:hypothetical protein
MLVLVAALLAAAPVPTTPTLGAPSEPQQTRVFKSARQALRDERPDDVLKLWLLRNALVDKGVAPLHDDDFESLVWVALGMRGLCPDGFPQDTDGAGLWPLAQHNWLLTRMTKRDQDRGGMWDAFVVQRQERKVALSDVLTKEELHTTRFDRGFCIGPYLGVVSAGDPEWPDFHDRFLVGTLMHQMLERSKETLVKAKVERTALIDARLFDLDLALAELRARKQRALAAQVAQVARSVGLPDEAVESIRKQIAVPPAKTDQTAFLQRTMLWSAADWLTLSRDRRLSLFARAREVTKDPKHDRDLVIGIIDGLLDRAEHGDHSAEGSEIESWIGFLDAAHDPISRTAITTGARGKRLLALDADSGFNERAVIALHRAVAYLEEGSVNDALASLGFALENADASSTPDVTHSLSLRWLSYLASQYESTPELVDTLRALASRRDVMRILEDLLWRAALRADTRSFDLVVQKTPHGGALDQRIPLLRLLAEGKAGAFANALAQAAEKEPQSALQIALQLVSRVEAEDLDVRRAQAPTLRLVLDMLRHLASEGAPLATKKKAGELRDRTLAILDGLGNASLPSEDAARTLSPEHEAFAGGVRLAPSDALPWPFKEPVTEAPSAFLPVLMVPFSRALADGTTITAWTITE